MMDERLQQIAEQALTDSVVRLVWQDTDENADAFVAMKGTGFFVDPDLIVTSLHGVAGAPAIVAERVSTETQFPVEGVVVSDIANDLVILKVTGEGVPLSLGDSDAVQMGDTVCTAGYPHGEKGVATQVAIHGIRERDKHFEVKAAFDPGQSGSPLLNRAGEVIGVAVAAYLAISFVAGGAPPSLDLSYAIPTSILAAMLADAAEAEPLAEWQKQPRIRGYAEGLKGQIQMMQQKHEAALAYFDTALELNPDLVETYMNRAAANLLLDRYEAVIADCSAALELNPDLFLAYGIRATAKFGLEQYTGALADYELALKLNPNAVQTYFGRADLKIALKDYTGAIEDFDKIINLSPEFTASLNIYARRADAKYRLKDYEGTIADYDKFIELNPKEHRAYIDRGRVKRIIGDYEGAIADCDQAIQLNSEQHAAYYNRAFAKRRLGDSKTHSERIILYQAAIDDYTEAIKLKPKYANTYHNRGFAKYQFGRSHAANGDSTTARQYYQAAVDDYTEAIKIDPKYLSAYSNRGRAKADLGQHQAAGADLAKAKELDPDVENKSD